VTTGIAVVTGATGIGGSSRLFALRVAASLGRAPLSAAANSRLIGRVRELVGRSLSGKVTVMNTHLLLRRNRVNAIAAAPLLSAPASKERR
jgi:hypothetical protein